MNEKKQSTRAGWLVMAAALVLAGAISILGASRPSSAPASKTTVTPSSASDVTPGPAQADSDVLELQLD